MGSASPLRRITALGALVALGLPLLAVHSHAAPPVADAAPRFERPLPLPAPGSEARPVEAGDCAACRLHDQSPLHAGTARPGAPQTASAPLPMPPAGRTAAALLACAPARAPPALRPLR